MEAIDIIRNIRIKKEISQKECAKVINLSIGGYSDIEHHRARLSADDFLKLCDFLDIDLYTFKKTTYEVVQYTSEEIETISKAIKILKTKFN